MQEHNKKTLEDIEASIKDAEESLGETEVRDLLIKKAEHFSRIGDKVCFEIVFILTTHNGRDFIKKDLSILLQT